MPVSSLRTSTKGAPKLAAPVVLPAASRHFAQRFSGGITPALTSTITDAGGGRAWFEDQLYPAQVADPGGLRVDGWFPSLARTPRELFDRQADETQGAWEVMYDLSRWTMARRMFSSRQLKEVMVDFWSNLLHVPLMDDDAMFYRVSYDTHDPHLRVDPVRLAAPALDRAPCDGPVPRQRGLHQGRAQREPGTGAARAAHRRHRRRLQRARREAVRQDAHRLPRRPVVALVPAVLRPHRPPHRAS